MRRSFEAPTSYFPQTKRAKVNQSRPESGSSDQSSALLESLRRQCATSDQIASLALINSPLFAGQVTRQDIGFRLLPNNIGQHLVGEHNRNINGHFQDDLLRILLLEQQIRNSSSGFTDMTGTSQARPTGLIDPSVAQTLVQLRALTSSTSLPDTLRHPVFLPNNSLFFLSPTLQGVSEGLSGSILDAELALFHHAQRLPLSNLRAQQLDEQIQSQLLASMNSDFRLPVPTAETPKTAPKGFLGHSSEGDRLMALAMDSENWVLSEYQCLLRQQIVFVESTASASNNNGKTQGRNKPIVPGQVGILCRHCASLPCEERGRGAIYYPAKLSRIYQAAQNMAHNHFASSCLCIPEETRQKLLSLKERKSVTVGAGKEYWYTAALNVGIRESEDSLYFCKEAQIST